VNFLRTFACVAALAASLALTACVAHMHSDLPVQTDFPAVTSAGGGTAISLVRPSDARNERQFIGVLKNDRGAAMHEVSPNEDPVIWVGNSFSAGLKHAGFKVEQVNSLADAPTPIAVTITVNEVFCQFTPSGFGFGLDGRGTVKVLVRIYKRGQEIARRSYSGTYKERRFPSSSSDYQAMIDGAMKDMLAKAIPNLAGVINREAAG
jgi:hypothetical protein